MTTTEYLQTPETVLPRELAYGDLRVADSPTVSHQRVVRDLTILLTTFVREQRIGEVLPAPIDVILDFDRALIVQPDLVFVARERRHIITDRIHGAPDAAIEVLSPHPRIGQLDERLGWFARYGVRECWLIDLLRREISVLVLREGRIAGRRLANGAQGVQSDVVPGLALAPQDLFGY